MASAKMATSPRRLGEGVSRVRLDGYELLFHHRSTLFLLMSLSDVFHAHETRVRAHAGWLFFSIAETMCPRVRHTDFLHSCRHSFNDGITHAAVGMIVGKRASVSGYGKHCLSLSVDLVLVCSLPETEKSLLLVSNASTTQDCNIRPQKTVSSSPLATVCSCCFRPLLNWFAPVATSPYSCCVPSRTGELAQIDLMSIGRNPGYRPSNSQTGTSSLLAANASVARKTCSRLRPTSFCFPLTTGTTWTRRWKCHCSDQLTEARQFLHCQSVGRLLSRIGPQRFLLVIRLFPSCGHSLRGSRVPSCFRR